MEVKIVSQPLEMIESQGNPKKVLGSSKAKTFEGLMNGKINHFIRYPQVNYSGQEIEFMLRGLLNSYNYFHPKEEIEIKNKPKEINKININKTPEYYELTRYRRKDKNSNPEPVLYIIGHKEVEIMIMALRNIGYLDNIKTEKVAEFYCKFSGLLINRYGEYLFKEGKFNWSNLFRDRQNHVYITDILTILDYFGVISYRKGNIQVLDLNKDF